MSYQISEQLLKYNRSGRTLKSQGFVIHSTATPNASAQNEHDYFNSGNRQASVHYFSDWSTIIRCVPENEVAWHAGSTANNRYLSVEMCEPSNDSTKFQEVWNRTVWLVGDACVRYGWNTEDNVWSHRGISNLYHETDHQDPISFLASYGKTWEQLLQAIDAKIIELKNPQSSIQTVNNNGDDYVLNVAILLNSKEDFYMGGYDVCERNGFCGIFIRNNGVVLKEALSAKKLIIVGGTDIPTHPNREYISGNTKFDTAYAVGKYLG